MGWPLGKLIILLNLVGSSFVLNVINYCSLIVETRRYLQMEALNTIQLIMFVDE